MGRFAVFVIFFSVGAVFAQGAENALLTENALPTETAAVGVGNPAGQAIRISLGQELQPE